MNSFTDWDNTLCHYGVLGMKWGIRRYQNKDGSLTDAGKKHYDQTGEYGFSYKSHATKKYEKKAAKQEAKGNTKKATKFQRRADLSREIDRKEQDYAESVRTGGNIATRLLTGGFVGGKAYQQHLAMNKSSDTGSKVASFVLARVGGRLLSSIRKAYTIRGDERFQKQALGDRFTANGATKLHAKAASSLFKELSTHDDFKKAMEIPDMEQRAVATNKIMNTYLRKMYGQKAAYEMDDNIGNRMEQLVNIEYENKHKRW